MRGLRRLLEMIDAGGFLVYASDYPHEHGAGPAEMLDEIDPEAREAVLYRNAAAILGLEEN